MFNIWCDDAENSVNSNKVSKWNKKVNLVKCDQNKWKCQLSIVILTKSIVKAIRKFSKMVEHFYNSTTWKTYLTISQSDSLY